jgi:peptidyl-prolyl cis-trans isomerase B (cyclophilin B)
VAGSKRERELARAKYERQQARKAQVAARRRRRTQVVTSVVVAALVVVGLVALGKVLGGSPGSTANASSTSPTATSTPTLTPSPSTSAAVIPTDGSNATCAYPAGGAASKKVTAPPTSAPTRPVIATAKLVLNGKTVTVALATAKAPCTVNSFRHLAAAGYFAKTPCHRLTTGSLAVLQCGDPTGTGSGGPGYSFADENLAGATYPAGTVAMANSGPNTNGSQFFLVYANSTLGPQYTPFGTVVGGMAVLQAISKAGVKGGGTDGAPAKPVTIDSVTVGG